MACGSGTQFLRWNRFHRAPEDHPTYTPTPGVDGGSPQHHQEVNTDSGSPPPQGTDSGSPPPQGRDGGSPTTTRRTVVHPPPPGNIHSGRTKTTSFVLMLAAISNKTAKILKQSRLAVTSQKKSALTHRFTLSINQANGNLNHSRALLCFLNLCFVFSF